MTSCYTEITKLCVISVYFFYITSYVIPLKEAAFSIEGNCDMGLRRCLFQIKGGRKMKRFVALTVAGALTLASLAGCQKGTAEKQPAGGETTESQAENGGMRKEYGREAVKNQHADSLG